MLLLFLTLKAKRSALRNVINLSCTLRNLFILYTNNNLDADQHAHPFLFTAYYYNRFLCKIRIFTRFYLASVAESAGLSLNPQREVISYVAQISFNPFPTVHDNCCMDPDQTAP